MKGSRGHNAAVTALAWLLLAAWLVVTAWQHPFGGR
jgi:hypothetical protein